MPLAARFRSFLTAAASARPLALVRIAAGAAAALYGSALWLGAIAPGVPAFLAAIWLVGGGLLAAGWKTRFAAGVVAGAAGLTLFLCPDLRSVYTYLLMGTAALLAPTAAGAFAGIDKAGGHWPASPAWAVALLKLQLASAYLYIAFSNLPFVSARSEPGVWANASPAVSMVLVSAWAFAGAALWTSAFRRAAFVLGPLLHLWSIFSAPSSAEPLVFAVTALGLYFLFLPSVPHSRTVVWDDRCSFCRQWIVWFNWLDWLVIYRFTGSSSPEAYEGTGLTREDTAKAVQLVTPAKTESGFDAVIGILEQVPAGCFWAPLLRVPPVPWIGRRAYAWVAANRSCLYEAIRRT